MGRADHEPFGDKEMRTDTADPGRLEQLTEETKNAAAEMRDPEAKRGMVQVVWGYKVLAEHAKARGPGSCAQNRQASD